MFRFHVCPECHQRNPQGAALCVRCGATLQRRFCRSCGLANDMTASTCRACGAPMQAEHTAGGTPMDTDPDLELDLQPAVVAAPRRRTNALAIAGVAVAVAVGAAFAFYRWTSAPDAARSDRAIETPPPRAVTPVPVAPALPAPRKDDVGPAPVVSPAADGAIPPESDRSAESAARPPVAGEPVKAGPATADKPAAVKPRTRTTPQAPAPTRPCTPELAALALCDPNSSAQRR